MDVRLPDGTVITNVPDGTTQSDLLARVGKMKTQGNKTENANIAETIAGNPVVRFALGAASPAIGAVQWLANNDYSPPVVRKAVNEHIAQLEAMKNRGMESSGNAGFDWAGLSGTVLSPFGLAATKALPIAATLPGKIGQGAAIGAAYGGLTPITNGGENFFHEKFSQVGLGTLTGGLMSGGIEAAKGLTGILKSAIEPATERGRTALLNRFQKELAGDKRPEIIAALRQAQEIVPGSLPTSGQAIAVIPESSALAAHQKAIAGTPVMSGAFESRTDAQEAARKAALGTIAKTPADLDIAIIGRQNVANFNYKAAFQNAVKADPELAKIAQNPYFKDALPDAIKLADANKVNPKKDLTQFLHFVKISLDKQVSKTGDTALSNTEKYATENIREKLIDWMSKKNPLYDVARQRHKSLSEPINQMEIGKYLQEKLVSPLEGTKERASSYAQALRDAPGTIKRATSSPYTKLGQILTPGQETLALSVGDDLARNAQYLERAARTNLTGSSNIADTMQPRLPNLLSRPAMVLNAVMKHLGENAEKKINKLAGERYLDPQKLADALEDVPQAQRGMITQLLMEIRNPALIGAPSTIGAGMFTQPQPALLNPQQR